MIGPLPPSLVRWLTNSTLVLRPAAAARRSASWAMVGRRRYSSALWRLSTTCRISSTNPSRPMKAVSWVAHRSRSSGVFTSGKWSSGELEWWSGGVWKGARSQANERLKLLVRGPSLHYSTTPFPSIRPHSQDLQDALKLGVAEKADFQSAFALGVAQLDFCPQPLAQLVLQAGHVGILNPRPGSTGPGGRAAGTGLQPDDQTLSLTDIESILDDALGRQILLLLVGEAENHFGVAHRQTPLAEVSLNGRSQFEQAQGICHGRAAFADFEGDFLLRELKLLHQLRVALGLFHRIEVFALEILDERQFEHCPVIGCAKNDRHLRQTQQLGGPPAAFAGDELEVAVALAHDEGLDDALFRDRIGQFAEGLRRKVFARLK